MKHKFKVWDVKNKHWLPIQKRNGFWEMMPMLAANGCLYLRDKESSTGFRFICEPNYIFCSGIGLKDENGTEMYGGDIVEVTHYTRKFTEWETSRVVIAWDAHQAAFVMKHSLTEEYPDVIDEYWLGCVYNSRLHAGPKIIGNIFENLELLKGVE